MEYDTIANVVDSISVPVIANGDITSPQQAETVLNKTGAKAVMIGRGAQGNPWIFRQINHYLQDRELLPAPAFNEIGRVMIRHLSELHKFYGEVGGVRISRKHIGWYLTYCRREKPLLGNSIALRAPKNNSKCFGNFFLAPRIRSWRHDVRIRLT